MRPSRVAVLWVCAMLLFAGSMLVSASAHAQRGHIRGAVEDSTGAPIPMVNVGVVGSSTESTTDARGAFRLAPMRPGVYFVRVRRLGFEPLIVRVDLEDGDTVSLGVTLNPSAANLAAVTVREDAVASRLLQVGFDERRRFSGAPAGQFVTRNDIQRLNPTDLTQMLARMARRAAECRKPVLYVDGSVMSPPPLDDPTGLLQSIKADSLQKLGSPAPRSSQLSQIPPDWIEGMEVYAGPSEIPSKYNPSGRGADCVILLWLR